MITAVIFAGGTGQRMKHTDLPKQFLKVGGKPIIIRTLEHFEKHPDVDRIVVACISDRMEQLRNLVAEYGIGKVVSIVEGGATGFRSIHNALVEVESLSDDIDGEMVLVCDGVRPILTQQLITECIEGTKKYGNAVPVTPCIDSPFFSEDGKASERSFDRNSLFITQAPQGYMLGRILWAHEEAIKRKLEDPISSADLFVELGEKIHLFMGDRRNIKITTPEDLEVLRATYYMQLPEVKNIMDKLHSDDEAGV